jgi:hypothetical protein
MPYPSTGIFPSPNTSGLPTSRTIVRTGIATYFGGSYVSNMRAYQHGSLTSFGLGTVRAGYPKELNMKDAFAGLPAGRMSGALMIVEIGDDQEVRQSDAGAPITDGSGNLIGGGIKRITYPISLDVYHISQELYAEDAQADVDLLIEAIKQQIRVDRTLGGICMDAGETSRGMKVIQRHSGQDASKRTLTSFSVAFEVRVNFIG